MKIGEIAALSGVSTKTIRFWEDEHLLSEPARRPSGYREYEAGIVERLAFIRQAQAAGFALDQIRQILDIGDSGDAPCQHVTDLIGMRLAEVEARIQELEATRARLQILAGRAADQDPADCQGLCSIIRPRPDVPGPPAGAVQAARAPLG